jgi:predicted nucleic acid-binding protein
MKVLVDSSVWVEYFNEGNASVLDFLIDENIVATNYVILSELVPFLKMRRHNAVIELLRSITQIPMNLDWEEIIFFQTQCLKKGSNGIGLPDLIIAQNAIQNNCYIYSIDKHFALLNRAIGVQVYRSKD